MSFKLDTRLEADSVWVADLPLSQCRVMNNRLYTWLILVPRLVDAVEIIDLDLKHQTMLLAEINLVGKLLKAHFPCDKLNVANLGNVVPQLHVHVIARCTGDQAWPKPVWGGASEPYSPDALQSLIIHLQSLLKQNTHA